MYGSEIMLWKDKERSRIRAADGQSQCWWVLGGWIVLNTQIRELFGVMKVFSCGSAMWKECLRRRVCW